MKDKNEESNEKKQEILFKLSLFEQQINQMQQQLQSVERGIIDLSSLELELDDLKGSNGKEILAPVGRGIFAKAKLLSEDLIMDVGGKNFVKKTIPETQDIIKGQIKKLEQIKSQLQKNSDEISREAEKLIKDLN
ncbi:MAG TPA: prefoldin subunit alpha [Candidatus Nanoarchaeia archaeon]|nr:prefoldin subunit alpha [Candidatus Nanoarchaeia archaeon]